MRFVIYGAGGIGGVAGARFFQSGHDVVLIARGAHLDVTRTRGLTIESPDDVATLPIDTVGAPNEITWRGDEVVLLAMKSQDTQPALDALAACVDGATPIVCVQNGVANERAALRMFENVYGVCVMCPTTHLEPGIVQASSSPVTGIMDVGRFPRGTDATADAIAAAFRASTFLSEARGDVMRAKYQKLLMNLANVIEAACGSSGNTGQLASMARAEGRAVYAAAGIDAATDEEDAARRGDHLKMRRIKGERRGGGSTWQSVVRGAPSLETDHLNGEIVLLGRLNGVPTPVNAMLQRLARELVASRAAPGSFTEADLLGRIDRS